MLLEWALDIQSIAMKSAFIPEWLPGPATVDTPPTQVDVWRIDLDERAESAKACTHDALHEILARYLPDGRQAVVIERSTSGKPCLSNPGFPLRFNLSHCRDLALVAISACCELGIDVERRRSLGDPLRLARRAFSDADVAILESLPPDRQPAGFLDLWTQLEARQKAFGRGVFAAPVDRASVRCITLRPTPHHYACVCGAQPRGALELRFFHFQPLVF